MTSHPSPSALATIAARVGATVEEDHGIRDLRTFQLCAPRGMVWCETGGLHLRIDWARGTSAQVRDYNRATLHHVAERVAGGVRLPTPEEADICDL